MSDWPYQTNVTEAPPRKPSWICPEGLCVCHPPVEGQPLEFAIMLCDEHGARMPGARCRVLFGGRVINDDQPNADGSGWLNVVVAHEVSSVLLEWAPAATPPEERYPYRLRYFLLVGNDTRWAAEHRLANLGFVGGSTIRDNVEAFQRQYGLRPVTGHLSDIDDVLRAFHDEARLPPVPADQAPSAPVPPAPPPAPPAGAGHQKIGKGHPPGQGTARSDMVARELRLLDFERNPAAGATYQIEVARWRFESTSDASGVAKFRAPRAAPACDANWQSNDAKFERRRIEILAHQQPGTFERLGNLGYAQPTLEERVRAYQREMGQRLTGKEEDVAQQVRAWHDGGPKPSASQKPTSALARGDVQLAAFVPPPLPLALLKDLSSAGPVVQSSGPFLVVKPPNYGSTDAELAAQFSTFASQLPAVAFSVTELTKVRPYFGVRDTEVHFSASTCKSIGLFTASLLLSAMRRYAASVGLTVPAGKLLDMASAEFQNEILEAGRSHPSLAPASDADLLPSYDKAFTVTAATGTATSHTVDFSSSMAHAIDEMMRISSNPHSGIVIDNTGFGYIHGALTHTFLSGGNEGLWLGGDYEGTRKAYRIPCVNDGDTAQGATTRTFVSMLDMALDATFPNTAFLSDKLALSRTRHTSWLTDPERTHRFHTKKGFIDERGKIGDDALKGIHGGHKVFSEIIEFRHIATGRRFLVSYQNARGSELAKISDLLFDGLTSYIEAVPLPVRIA